MRNLKTHVSGLANRFVNKKEETGWLVNVT